MDSQVQLGGNALVSYEMADENMSWKSENTIG